jgi:serine/threonine protein kinase
MAACQHCGTTFESGRFCPACGRAFRGAHETRDPLLGAVIDGLRFDAVLGRGMSGCVYRVTQLALERPLAVKVPSLALAGDDTAMRRFRREALALARISHPGVVAVHAIGDMPDSRPYLAIEFLDGHSLEHAIGGDEARMPVGRAVDLALQIAEALAEVHARDIVHRDLKPDNVMLVRPQVGGDRAVLIDFGIALPNASADATRLTHGGGIVGTPHYMAPEQVQGDEIDGRADIYSLGATLYRLLTGRVPFDGTGVEVVVAHLARSVVPVRELAPDVSPGLEAVVMKCLAKRVSDRWDDATSLARALAELDATAGDPARAPRAKRVSNVPPGLASADPPRRAPTRPPTRPATAPPVPTRPPPTEETDLVGLELPRRPARTGRIVGGIAAVTIIGAGIAFGIAYESGSPAEANPPGVASGSGSAAGSGGDPPDTPDDSIPTRALIIADAGLSMRVVVPEQIVVNRPARFALEIWDEDGVPVDATEVVVTVEGDGGESRGFSASRAGLGRSVFAFTTRFPAAGKYRLRVFPPVGDATFVVDLEVAPA